MIYHRVSRAQGIPQGIGKVRVNNPNYSRAAYKQRIAAGDYFRTDGDPCSYPRINVDAVAVEVPWHSAPALVAWVWIKPEHVELAEQCVKLFMTVPFRPKSPEYREAERWAEAMMGDCSVYRVATFRPGDFEEEYRMFVEAVQKAHG